MGNVQLAIDVSKNEDLMITFGYSGKSGNPIETGEEDDLLSWMQK